MINKIKILIADDHPIIRRGLRSVLASVPEFESIVEAENGIEAMRLLKENEFDIATLDVEMPGLSGLEIAAKLSEYKIKTAIVFITMYNDERMFNYAMKEGAMGFILKENAVTDIVDCIKNVADGKHYISPAISHLLLKREKKNSEFINSFPSINDLTRTERKILELIAKEKTTKEISEELFISNKTVENHRSNISKKLNLHGAHSLVKFAITNKALL
jgi:DNA-binding NarL/FixJ family response regulator